MATNDDVEAIENRMAEWARILVERGGFPLMLVYVTPDSELRFLTTAGPGTIPIAEALEGAAARIRAGEMDQAHPGPTAAEGEEIRDRDRLLKWEQEQQGA
jgi:hypothetical protein